MLKQKLLIFLTFYLTVWKKVYNFVFEVAKNFCYVASVLRVYCTR